MPPEIAFELYGNTIWATPIFMRLGKELIVQASLLMEHEHSVKGHMVFEASAQYSCIFLTCVSRLTVGLSTNCTCLLLD